MATRHHDLVNCCAPGGCWPEHAAVLDKRSGDSKVKNPEMIRRVAEQIGFTHHNYDKRWSP